jgi:hypothetical protein
VVFTTVTRAARIAAATPRTSTPPG